MKKINLLGMKFNRLTVIDEELQKTCTDAVWKCLCECGNVSSVKATKLKNGTTKSCGCWNKERFISDGIKYIQSEEGRKMVSVRNSLRTGSNAYNWRGGKDEENVRLRKSQQAKEWKLEVFERDEYLCTECKTKGKRLNAHHIKPWSIFPEFRYDLDNGLTVCVDCHRNLHKINGNPKRKVA